MIAQSGSNKPSTSTVYKRSKEFERPALSLAVVSGTIVFLSIMVGWILYTQYFDRRRSSSSSIIDVSELVEIGAPVLFGCTFAAVILLLLRTVLLWGRVEIGKEGIVFKNRWRRMTKSLQDIAVLEVIYSKKGTLLTLVYIFNGGKVVNIPQVAALDLESLYQKSVSHLPETCQVKKYEHRSFRRVLIH